MWCDRSNKIQQILRYSYSSEAKSYIYGSFFYDKVARCPNPYGKKITIQPFTSQSLWGAHHIGQEKPMQLRSEKNCTRFFWLSTPLVGITNVNGDQMKAQFPMLHEVTCIFYLPLIMSHYNFVSLIAVTLLLVPCVI